MKKLFVVLLSIVAFCASAQDFRNVTWGMTQEEVKNAETAEVYTEMERFAKDDKLFYKADIIGYKSTITYFFEDNALVGVVVMFRIVNSSDNKYVEDYAIIEDALNSKYGKGKLDIYWRDNLYKDDFNYIGFALSRQDVEYSTSWKLDRTAILLSMSANNKGKISIGITYRDVNYLKKPYNPNDF